VCSQLNALFRTAAETGEAMPIPDFSVNNLDVKIDDVCRLLSGQRMFGVPSGRKPTPLPQYLTLQYGPDKIVDAAYRTAAENRHNRSHSAKKVLWPSRSDNAVGILNDVFAAQY